MHFQTSSILFEDANLIVINKAAGLLSQGAEAGEDNLVDQLREYFGRHYVGLVHRLDRNTSGLIVVAKRTKAAQRLTLALQKDQLKRSYLALVEGSIEKKGTLNNFLLKDEKNNLMKVVSEKNKSAKKAILHFEKLSEIPFQSQNLSLVSVHLETGRSHQIRIQLSHYGFPLLGDKKYSSKFPFPRPALHSWKLSFPHPISKEIMNFTAPLPEDFSKINVKINS